MSEDFPEGRIKASVYKGSKRDETYLFVPGRDAFDRVPEALLDALGQLEHVMEFELHEGRRLAHSDVVSVMRSLVDQGYYLQMPPVDSAGRARVH